MEPKRKNIRLKNYDYRQNGLYFITISTHNRQKIFTEEAKPLISKTYKLLESKYPYCRVIEEITMPNHIHCILGLEGEDPLEERQSISQILQWFKGSTTIHYIEKVKEGTLPPFRDKVWQKGFYERVLRSEEEVYQVRKYIRENPLKLKLLQEEWKKKDGE